MGVELTTDNIIHVYYYDHFDLDLKTFGIIVALFGMANIIAHPFSGFVSDLLTRRFSMRGCFWNVWILQTLGGAFCVWLSQAKSLSLFICAICFSACIHAACGVVFCVVPFVFRWSLGIVNGMTE